MDILGYIIGCTVKPLTKRELEVVRKIALGYSNRRIAHELYVTEAAIKGHVTNLLKKFECRSRLELAVMWNKRTQV
jgi:DNA-binding NarL/FixJ family response regulator